MGVRVRFHKGAWWVFIAWRGQRKAKRIGDRQSAEQVASAIRARLQMGDLSMLTPDPPQQRGAVTLRAFAAEWLGATR